MSILNVQNLTLDKRIQDYGVKLINQVECDIGGNATLGQFRHHADSPAMLDVTGQNCNGNSVVLRIGVAEAASISGVKRMGAIILVNC